MTGCVGRLDAWFTCSGRAADGMTARTGKRWWTIHWQSPRDGRAAYSRRRYNGLYRRRRVVAAADAAPQPVLTPSLRLCPSAAAGLLQILCPHCFNAEKKGKVDARSWRRRPARNYNGAKTVCDGCRRFSADERTGRDLDVVVPRLCFPFAVGTIIVLQIKT